MPKNHPEDSEQSFEKHIPVLLPQVVETLKPQQGESYLDLTAGYGGHAEVVLGLTRSPAKTVLVDRDERAVSELSDKFGSLGARIIHQDYLSASSELVKDKQFDIILADLGVSSQHLQQAERGFSVNKPARLDMRMDRRQELDAEAIVNKWPEDKLLRILREFGEEPKAAKIAKKIVQNRPIHTTDQLAAIVNQVWWGRSKIHPATRTFQALRIAVNDELHQLEEGLPLWEELLAPGGRLAVISFHSLEDRLVKRFFAQHSGNRYDASLKLLTKKPMTAGENEIVSNPRARSAKLRAVAKIKTKKGKP